jgi:DNA-binding beta-propeller fold protein YncE
MTGQLRILPAFGLAASLLVSHGPFILLSVAVALGMTARPARADILYVSTEVRDIDKIISDGTVSVFSRLLPPSVYPAGLAFDASRNVYATDPNQGQIDKISPTGTVSLFATVPSFPYGLAFDTSGNLYVAGLFTDEINKITPAGAVSLFATLPTESDPNGLAFDASGNLYVTMDSMDQISRITSSGSVSVFATLPPGSSPRGVAFDSSGSLYAADFSPTRSAKSLRAAT